MEVSLDLHRGLHGASTDLHGDLHGASMEASMECPIM